MREELLNNWNIGQIETIELTSEGGGRTWFVKTTSDDEFVLKESDLIRSEREYKYIRGLSKTGIPVASHIKTVDGSWYTETANQKICCLYPKLPGNVIIEHYGEDARRRAQGFGQAIGNLHNQFQKINYVNEHRQMDFIGQLQRWAIPTVEKEETIVDAQIILKIWKDIEPGLTSLCEKVPLQLIHRDAHTSNMLFDAGNLTGFLDFEMVTQGLPIFDVCYCGGCIRVSGFGEPEKGNEWLALFQTLLQGYQEYRSLSHEELKSIFETVIGIELIFLAFWLDKGNNELVKQTERLLIWLENNKNAIKGLETA